MFIGGKHLRYKHNTLKTMTTSTTSFFNESIDQEIDLASLSQMQGAGIREWWAQRPTSVGEALDTAIDYYLGDTADAISSNTRRQQGDTGVYSPPDQEGSDDPFVVH